MRRLPLACCSHSRGLLYPGLCWKDPAAPPFFYKRCTRSYSFRGRNICSWYDADRRSPVPHLLVKDFLFTLLLPQYPSLFEDFQSIFHTFRMRRLFLSAAVLATTLSLARGGAPSAGNCGPTSVPGVPGCWGTPVSPLHRPSVQIIILTMNRRVHMFLQVT